MKDVIKTTQRPDEIKTINGRRVRVNRRERRDNLKSYYALAVVFTAFVVMFLCLTVFFRTSNVEINGVSFYRPEQIMAVGGIEKGANLVRMDTDIIEQRLKENLVYIDDVTVKKDYPASIVVDCKQAVKAADIKVGKSYSVVSSSGRILEINNAERNDTIPLVEGFELKTNKVGASLESKDSGKADILVKLLSSINNAKLTGITQINIKSKGNIILTYKEKIQIKPGGISDIDYKLSYFKEVIKRLTDDYEGTLIYNGTEGGISAIPKENETEVKKNDSSSKADSSQTDSQGDNSQAESTYSENTGDSTQPEQTQAPAENYGQNTGEENNWQTTAPVQDYQTGETQNTQWTNGNNENNGNNW